MLSFIALLSCVVFVANAQTASWSVQSCTDGTLSVNLGETSEAVGGFQFSVSGATIGGAYGGLAEEAGFSISAADTGTVIGFSFSGDTFECDDDECTMVVVEQDAEGGDEVCVSEMILSTGDGESFSNDDSSCDTTALCVTLDISLETCVGGSAGGVDVVVGNTDGYGVAGFQFTVTGATVTGADGGASEEAGFSVSTADSTGVVIAFSFSGDVFVCEDDSCVVITLETDASGGDTVCIEDEVFSSADGDSFDIDNAGCVEVQICVELDISMEGCSGGMSGGVDVYTSTTEAYSVGGFQFGISGANINSAYGGAAEDAGFSISTSSSLVIAFSLTGDTFSCDDDACWILTLDTDAVAGDEVCIEDEVFSTSDGSAFPTTVSSCLEVVSCVVIAVELEDGGSGSANIYINSTEGLEIAGLQFDLETGYSELIDVSGGLIEDAGLEVSFASETGRVIAFSLSGAAITCDEDLCWLTTAYFEGTEEDTLCLTNEILSTWDGGSLATSVGGCITLTFCQADGDVNFDGGVDVLDIVLIVNQVIYPDEGIYAEGSCELVAMDYNLDGNIDVLDIVQLVNVILY